MKLSYDAIWQDILAMLKTHADIILVVAGAFMFLPTLAQQFYLPAPPLGLDPKSAQVLALYFEANILPLLALQLVKILGGGALLSLLLHPSRPSVGEAIGAATRMLPTLFFLSLIRRLLLTLCVAPVLLVAKFLSDGFFTYALAALSVTAAILCAIVIFSRTFTAEASAMARDVRNPAQAIAHSVQMSFGVGWQMFGLIVILAVVTWICSAAATAVIGVPALLFLPTEEAGIAQKILYSFGEPILTLVFVLLSASFYRALSEAKSGI